MAITGLSIDAFNLCRVSFFTAYLAFQTLSKLNLVRLG